jgi:dGTPase
MKEGDLPDSSHRVLGRGHASRLNSLILDAIEASWAATGESAEGSTAVIRFSPPVRDVANELREFMFRRVYFYDQTRTEAERGKRVVLFLFEHFRANPRQISAGFSLPEDPVERQAADYVSGMTDRYAIRLARQLGCPDADSWDV